MKKTTGKLAISIIQDLARIGGGFILAISFVMMMIAMVDRDTKGEAPIGTFSTSDFTDGWTLVQNGEETPVTLPARFDTGKGNEVVISNTLPDTITDGSSFMIRSAMEDVYIYIEDEVRASYATKQVKGKPYYLPSAYVVADLTAEDAGKEIRIFLRAKSAGFINAPTLGLGNNVWFRVVQRGMPVNFAALLVLLLGVTVGFLAVLLGGRVHARATLYLGLLMVDVSLWVISESTMRQFLFRRPSLSQYFAYFTVELIGLFACMYFDEVQHRTYHNVYVILEAVVLFQVIMNFMLHVIGVYELYRSMFVSHALTGICAAFSIGALLRDLISKRIEDYWITAIGMGAFVVIAMCELVAFYIDRFHAFGSFLCIAMIFLMTATVIQTIYDEMGVHEDHDKELMEMTIHTIETIATAIDAKDEYTGGHSERVGFYASRLAREMAVDYDLSEDDIMRVQYIGFVHDIGKIAVADGVLNKSGKLSEEEYNLMKKHVDIGYEMVQSLGNIMPGLLDGIRYHHERFDGKGYPEGLSGTDIPLVARILALADSYDAMTSNRVYRKRLTDEKVREELVNGAGTQFDPSLAEIFVNLLDRGELRILTDHGVALDPSGKKLISAELENKLQKDLLEKRTIKNPTYVRMLCYIIKLMERKDRRYMVYFVGLEGEEEDIQAEWSEIKKSLSAYLDHYTLMVSYDKFTNVLAFYDRTEADVLDVFREIRTDYPDVKIVKLGSSH